MSRRLTSSAMRYLDMWHESVRDFDSVEPGSPEERAGGTGSTSPVVRYTCPRP